MPRLPARNRQHPLLRFLRNVTMLIGILISASPALGATFTVDSTADAVDSNPGDGVCATAAGACTLRAAIQEANALESDDTVVLPTGTFALTLTGAGEDAAATGDLDVLCTAASCGTLAIAGAGANATTIDGQDADRLFDRGFDSFPPLSISDLTMRHGDTPDHDGNALRGSAALTLERVVLRDNNGSAISASSNSCCFTTITDSTVFDAIQTRNALALTRSTFHAEVRKDIGGLASTVTECAFLASASLYTYYGDTTVVWSRFEDASVGGFHGFLQVEDTTILRGGVHMYDGSATLLRTEVTESVECGARAIGPELDGSITVVDSTLSGNGCGISSPNVVVRRSRIVDNDGAGIEVGFGNAVIENSLIARNGGGGIALFTPYPVKIRDTAIVANTKVGSGAGLLASESVNGYTLELTNVTVSGNTATGSGGGMLARFSQGATDASPNLSNVTITGNRADSDGDGDGAGGGLAVDAATTLIVQNSIVAGNATGTAGAPDCAGPLTSAGYNLLGDTSGCTVSGDLTGVQIGVDPLLAALDDNGGPTATHALLADSPARDAGNPLGCTDQASVPLTTDQRGVARPQFGRCDIGAFEFACGNSTTDLGETCDDGNSLDGDCCSAVCQLDPNGSPCTDGNACTTEACDGAGTCIPGSAVDCGACQACDTQAGCVANMVTGCRQPTESFSGQLLFLNGTTPKLKWQWAKGEATSIGDFGNPFVGDRYSVCLFDESGSTPQVAFRATTRAGLCGGKPCWRTAGASSFKYKDVEHTPDGLDSVLLKSGPDGKAKLLVSGRGSELALPTLPLALPARMQLQAENGQCWEAQYFEVGASRNDGTQFKAKAFQP